MNKENGKIPAGNNSQVDNSKQEFKSSQFSSPYTSEDTAQRNFAIPEELRRLKQWGVAKAIWNDEKGKFEKFPFQTNGQPAKTNDSRTWSHFYNVRNAEHLAFFFNRSHTGMDFDSVIHNGEIEKWVIEDFIEPIGSYTEISVSGTGIHILVRGGKPKGLGSKISLKDGHSIEIYDSGRFFLLTGNVYRGYRELKPLDQETFFRDYIKSEFEGPVQPRKIGNGIKDVESIIKILTPYWAKGSGNLHFMMLRLAGYVASCGGNESDLQQIISELIRRTGNGQSRPRIVSNAYRNSKIRLNEGGKVSGRNSLKEIMEVIANEPR